MPQIYEAGMSRRFRFSSCQTLCFEAVHKESWLKILLAYVFDADAYMINYDIMERSIEHEILKLIVFKCGAILSQKSAHLEGITLSDFLL